MHLKRGKMSFDLMFQKANELYLNGAYEEADKIYRELLAFIPQSPDVLNMLGLVAEAKNEHLEAVTFFQDALKNAQNPLPIYFNMAVSLGNASKFHEAISAYLEVLKLAPKTKEAYNNLGAVYEKLKDYEKARNAYQKAIELDQNYIDPVVNLAVLDHDIQTLKKLDGQGNFLATYHLALICYDSKEYLKALEYILKADQILEAYDIKNLAAQIYLALNDKDNAIKYFHQALLINSSSLDALINLSTLEQNESYFKKALSISKNSLDAHIRYADFLYQQKRTVEALEEYRKAVLINPDLPQISNNIALILKDMGEYKEALDLLMNAFIKDPLNEKISLNISETLVLLYEKEPDEALKIAKLWHANAENNVFASHTLSSFENLDLEDQNYASSLFDLFAETYDDTMKNINYRVFEKVKELKVDIKGKVLDLGCGTGLAALNLKTPNSSWTGVDISKNMIKCAQEKGLYDQLIESDILSFLEKNKIKYDFVLAFDVLEYIKDIQSILALCAGTTILLTFEEAPLDVRTYQLSKKGRYQHSKDYIKELLEDASYQNIEFIKLALRLENGQPVMGYLAYAK